MLGRNPLLARSFGGAGRVDPSSGLGAVHGNEPVGATVALNRAYNALDETDDAGVTWIDSSGESATLPVQTVSIVTDATAPQSASNVGRVELPAAYSGDGVSNPAVRCTGPLTDLDTQGQQFYLEFWFKISANYYGHTGGQNKIFYIGQPVIFEFGSPGVADSPTFNWTLALQGGENFTGRWNTPGNEVSPTDAERLMVRDTWYHVEILLEMNTPGVANGSCHFWVNGAKIIQFTGNRNILAGGGTQYSSIAALDYHPIYGGQYPLEGDTYPQPLHDVPETMYQYMDHIYVSTVL